MAEETKTTELAVPFEWALKKVLGPTLDALGKDMSLVYVNGRNMILEAAKRKVGNMEDGASVNLRVAREVFLNGSFTEDAVCAEYFGGALASSRTEDGKDDTAIYYVDLIRSLSSSQLKLHYVFYRSLNKLLTSDVTKVDLNVGLDTEINGVSMYLAAEEVRDLNIDMNLEALFRKGLLQRYGYDALQLEDGSFLPYMYIYPTSLGIQLFAIANNQMGNWRSYQRIDFGDFEEIKLPAHSAYSLQELKEKYKLI